LLIVSCFNDLENWQPSGKTSLFHQLSQQPRPAPSLPLKGIFIVKVETKKKGARKCGREKYIKI
jgi:hypothetical protein